MRFALWSDTHLPRQVTEGQGDRGDDPIEELKAMHYLTTRGAAGENTGLVPVLDYFADNHGWLYIVQPHYERQDLYEVIQSTPELRFDAATSRSTLHCVLAGLQELKALGVGHMDIR